MKTILCVLATLAFAPVALAAPPAAPVVSVGASNIKQLQFDWPAVPGTSRYELWFRVASGGQWAKLSETSGHGPIIRTNVSVHLLDWRTAQYRVAACNASGCTNSAAVGVEDLALDAVGYLKQNYDGEGRWFGQGVAMSADGMTAAVATANAGGRNADNGVVYVYRKTSSSAAWRFDARLTPSLFRSASSQPYTSRDTLAVNGDGTLIAFGRGSEGIGGQSFNGAVYLFRRSGTTWTQEKRLASGIANDWFGNAVDLDDAGNTLAVWHHAGNINLGEKYGVTEIYTHTSAGWQPAATIPVPAGGYANCQSQALSGDGKTLFRTCFQEREVVLVHNAPGWAESARIDAGSNNGVDTNFDGTLFVAQRSLPIADVYRLQQNVWSPDSGAPFAFINDSTTTSIYFTSVAMSRDGKFIAIGDAQDEDGTVGPNYPPLADNENGSLGAVYVFERKPAGWNLRRMMKPSVVARSNYGNSLGISGNGHNLIVGAVDDLSGATGMHGDPADTSTPQNRGAAWLY